MNKESKTVNLKLIFKASQRLKTIKIKQINKAMLEFNLPEAIGLLDFSGCFYLFLYPKHHSK